MIVVWRLVIFASQAFLCAAYQVEVQCNGALCSITNKSCHDDHPYAEEMARCYTKANSEPRIPFGACTNIPSCLPCVTSTPWNLFSHVQVKPFPIVANVTPVVDNSFRIAVGWQILTEDRLAAYEVRVYQEQYQNELATSSLIFSSCLGKNNKSFELELSYATTRGITIRIEIISEPYADGDRADNTATMQFPWPVSCQEIPEVYRTKECSVLEGYNNLTINAVSRALKHLDGTVEATISWADVFHANKEQPYPVQHYVMMGPANKLLSCIDKLTTTCFVTNGTSAVLKPLNGSFDYQIMVQRYIPCMSNYCSNSSIILVNQDPSFMHRIEFHMLSSMKPLPASTSAIINHSFFDASKHSVFPIILAPIFCALSAIIIIVIITMRYKCLRASTNDQTNDTSMIDTKNGNKSMVGDSKSFQSEICQTSDCNLSTIRNTTGNEPLVSCGTSNPSIAVGTENLISLPPGMPLKVFDVGQCSKSNEVFVVYSSDSTPEEVEAILHFLIYKLRTEYQINSTCYDLMKHSIGVAAYMVEEKVRTSVAILCVCNKSFCDEWNDIISSKNSMVIYVKSLLAADLQSSKNISKYAVVLLKRETTNYVPTDYLRTSKQFYLTDTVGISQFVIERIKENEK